MLMMKLLKDFNTFARFYEICIDINTNFSHPSYYYNRLNWVGCSNFFFTWYLGWTHWIIDLDSKTKKFSKVKHKIENLKKMVGTFEEQQPHTIMGRPNEG